MAGLSACSPKGVGTFVEVNKSETTIVGGNAVKKNSDSANRVVMISTDTDDGKTILCTGTFIDKKIILTAAHCVNKNPQLMTVTFSPRPFEDSGAQILTVDRVVIYPKKSSERDDLAVIRIDGGMPATAQVTALPNASLHLAPVNSFIALGYGRTDGIDAEGTVDWVGAGALRAVMISSVDFSGKSPTFTVNQENGKGVCFGDSGGPALALSPEKQWIVLGVASGVFDSESADPSVAGFDSCTQRSMYINVIKYLSWIKQTRDALLN